MGEQGVRASRNAGRGLFRVLLAAAAIGITGTVVVKAAEDPHILATLREFHKPVRRAVEPATENLPAIFRPRRAAPPPQALGYAPSAGRFEAPARPARSAPKRDSVGLPTGALDTTAAPGFFPVNEPTRTRPSETRRARALPKSPTGAGLPTATNFCVRLCDGLSFPIGEARGDRNDAQEAACRLACPGAATALYSAPAGSDGIESATRGGAPYTALPTAFRHRDGLNATCSCKPIGASTSSLALLTDFTLKKGDLVMTRVGMRHFDGSQRFPYRANAFSDALSKIRDKREQAQIRAMEAASMRGILPEDARLVLRDRVTREIRSAERQAAPAKPASPRLTELPRAIRAGGFVSVERAPGFGAPTGRALAKRDGMIALN